MTTTWLSRLQWQPAVCRIYFHHFADVCCQQLTLPWQQCDNCWLLCMRARSHDLTSLHGVLSDVASLKKWRARKRKIKSRRSTLRLFMLNDVTSFNDVVRFFFAYFFAWQRQFQVKHKVKIIGINFLTYGGWCQLSHLRRPVPISSFKEACANIII